MDFKNLVQCGQQTQMQLTDKIWDYLLYSGGGERDDRGWDGWMASPNWWIWVWASFGSWWWTGKPGVLQSMGLQRIRHNWATELNCLQSILQPSLSFHPPSFARKKISPFWYRTNKFKSTYAEYLLLLSVFQMVDISFRGFTCQSLPSIWRQLVWLCLLVMSMTIPSAAWYHKPMAILLSIHFCPKCCMSIISFNHKTVS